MLRSLLLILTLGPFGATVAAEPVHLANSAWSPFIVEGETQGTSEQIVCTALERAGRGCSVDVREWTQVLAEARSGQIDGIAAAWKTPEREEFLLFSEPYLTNRIVPILNAERPVDIRKAADLIGLRVAMIEDFAYGEEIEAMVPDVRAIWLQRPMDAIMMVRNREADVAIVDELVARKVLDETMISGIQQGEAVLVFRDLHFAVSRAHPNAEGIIADFHRAFEAMLDDGTVNEILDMDWLATDFGHEGRVDIVMRSGVKLDELDNPWKRQDSVYALERSEYQMMQETSLQDSGVNYRVDGKSHSSLQSALNQVFGEDTVCTHTEYSSTFDCTKLLKKLGTNR